jgi:hypothetical protein
MSNHVSFCLAQHHAVGHDSFRSLKMVTMYMLVDRPIMAEESCWLIMFSPRVILSGKWLLPVEEPVAPTYSNFGPEFLHGHPAIV